MNFSTRVYSRIARIPCHHCGYDLTGMPVGTGGRKCPECGQTSPDHSPQHWLWNRPTVGTWLGIVAVCSAFTFGVGKGSDNGLDGILAVAALAPAAGLLSGILTMMLLSVKKELPRFSWNKASLAAIAAAVLTAVICGIAGVVGASLNSGRAI
jgi:hypothetical protein